MERSIKSNFFIDLESIQHKLSSEYSLNVCFSRRFPYIYGPSFSQYKPLQNMSVSERSVACIFFQEFYILTRTQGIKYMFLVKIASKRTSLNWRKAI